MSSVCTCTHHTHTRLMALCPGLPGWASTKRKTNLDFTEARNSEWRWHQLGHMQVWPCSRQIPHQLLTAQFFYGRMPFLPPNQQRQSTEGMYVCTCTGTINAFSNKIFSPLYNKPSLPDLFLQAFLARLTLKRKHLRITGGSFSQDGCHSCYQKTVGLLKLWQHLCSVIQMLITTTWQ